MLNSSFNVQLMEISNIMHFNFYNMNNNLRKDVKNNSLIKFLLIYATENKTQ